MKRATFSLVLAFSMMGLCLWLAAYACAGDGQTLTYRVPDHVESYTVGSLDRLQICKTYVVEPGENPACISTEAFQEYGSTFCLTKLTEEHCGEVDIYTVIFTEADP